jgi:hypothetical protein
MHVGMTGTRFGMTTEQKYTFRKFMKAAKVTLHHGDCIGADADAHDIAQEEYGHDIVIHPPVKDEHRAWRSWSDVPYRGTVEIKTQKTHFARNRDIVDESSILLATPYTMQEEDRGGTWYTINYAKKKGKPYVVIWPDGRMTSGNLTCGFNYNTAV